MRPPTRSNLRGGTGNWHLRSWLALAAGGAALVPTLCALVWLEGAQEITPATQGGKRCAVWRDPCPNAGILVHDLDAFARQLEGHGLVPEWDDAFPGMRRFYLRDNNSNRLEFLSPGA